MADTTPERLARIEEALSGVKDTIKAVSETIEEVRTELHSSKPAWWQWVGALAGLAALSVTPAAWLYGSVIQNRIDNATQATQIEILRSDVDRMMGRMPARPPK